MHSCSVNYFSDSFEDTESISIGSDVMPDLITGQMKIYESGKYIDATGKSYVRHDDKVTGGSYVRHDVDIIKWLL